MLLHQVQVGLRNVLLFHYSFLFLWVLDYGNFYQLQSDHQV